jgi:hypothetical protein
MSKLKLRFAQRINVKLTPKHDTDGAASNQRLMVLAETNKYQLNIDRASFSKTPKEKEEVRTAKLHYRKLQSLK